MPFPSLMSVRPQSRAVECCSGDRGGRRWRDGGARARAWARAEAGWVGEWRGSAQVYKSCALVGNSGVLLRKERGAEIDNHDLVLRLDRAPTVGCARA